MSLGAGAKAGAIRFAAPRLVPLLERQDTTMLARVRGHLPHFPVVLHAVLSRQAVDVAAVRGLQEGDVIRLPEHCLQQIRLETASGGLIRKARLGQLGGHRAVRLSEPVQTPAPGADAASLAPLAAMPLAAPVDDPLPHSPDDLPEMPDTADTAQPAAPVLPDLPPLGSAMDADGLPDLPELPELPELPDLPDLPEHP